MIPYALGLGLATWGGIWMGIHNFRHQLSQEERAAVYTGAAERPKAKIKVLVESRDCTHLTHADLDGESLVLYAKNDCHVPLRYLAWHWQMLSPNRTVIAQGHENTSSCAVPIQPGDTAECHTQVVADDRAETLRVWTSQ